jgi:hypothetical protein
MILTGFARIPPKLPVSYPKSISPTSRQKHEKKSIGLIMPEVDRELSIVVELLKGPQRGPRRCR